MIFRRMCERNYKFILLYSLSHKFALDKFISNAFYLYTYANDTLLQTELSIYPISIDLLHIG